MKMREWWLLYKPGFIGFYAQAHIYIKTLKCKLRKHRKNLQAAQQKREKDV